MVIDKESEIGVFIKDYNKLSHDSRERLMGYMKALKDLDNPVSRKKRR